VIESMVNNLSEISNNKEIAEEEQTQKLM